MKKIALVYNPVSGAGTFKKRLDYYIDAFQRRGMLLIPYRTQKDSYKDFDDFMDAVNPEGIIAAGGDGTLSEVVNLMMAQKNKLPIGIIGSGTSNDFASYLRINEDLEDYFDAIYNGKTRSVDLGYADGKYFINVASAGILTSVAHEVAPRLKNSLGKMAYYLKGLGEIPKFRSIPLHIEANGKSYDEEVFLFVVINSATVGSMKNVGTNVKIDDGKLDFLAVKKCSVRDFMKLFKDLVRGKPITGKKGAIHISSEEFFVSSTEDVKSDLDGEAGPNLPLEIKTVHNAISVYTI